MPLCDAVREREQAKCQEAVGSKLPANPAVYKRNVTWAESDPRLSRVGI
jgi:hypothetical protein